LIIFSIQVSQKNRPEYKLFELKRDDRSHAFIRKRFKVYSAFNITNCLFLWSI